MYIAMPSMSQQLALRPTSPPTAPRLLEKLVRRLVVHGPLAVFAAGIEVCGAVLGHVHAHRDADVGHDRLQGPVVFLFIAEVDDFHPRRVSRLGWPGGR